MVRDKVQCHIEDPSFVLTKRQLGDPRHGKSARDKDSTWGSQNRNSSNLAQTHTWSFPTRMQPTSPNNKKHSQALCECDSDHRILLVHESSPGGRTSLWPFVNDAYCRVSWSDQCTALASKKRIRMYYFDGQLCCQQNGPKYNNLPTRTI